MLPRKKKKAYRRQYLLQKTSTQTYIKEHFCDLYVGEIVNFSPPFFAGLLQMLEMYQRSELLFKKQQPEAYGGVGQARNWVLGENAPTCRDAIPALRCH